MPSCIACHLLLLLTILLGERVREALEARMVKSENWSCIPELKDFKVHIHPQGVVGLHAHQSGLFKSIQDQAALRPASVCHALVSLFGHAWQKTSLETLLQKVRYLCGHEEQSA